MPTVNATWRLLNDPQTGQFMLRVEYNSNEPPQKHEETHRRIVEKAVEVLRQYGLTDEQMVRTRVEVVRLPPQPVPEPSVTEPPIPEKQ
jgi:hypothetical protein